MAEQELLSEVAYGSQLSTNQLSIMALSGQSSCAIFNDHVPSEVCHDRFHRALLLTQASGYHHSHYERYCARSQPHLGDAQSWALSSPVTALRTS